MIDRSQARPLAPGPGAQARPRRAGTIGCRRLVVVTGGDLVLCAGVAHTGPLRREFWAVWDRATGRLWERPGGGPCMVLTPHRLSFDGGGAAVDLALEAVAGRAGVRGTIRLDNGERPFAGSALLLGDIGPAQDNLHGWCAGTGTDVAGQPVAWCFAAGSETGDGVGTIWRDGFAAPCDAARFAGDLASVAFRGGGEQLRCHEEVAYGWRDRFLWIGARCDQPFVRFTGALPGGVVLREGTGVIGHCAPR